jgi:electron transport complex protein RnfD
MLKSMSADGEISPDMYSIDELPGYLDMFLGNVGGCIGEISALALLLRLAYMLWRKVITWHIPVAVLGTMALFALCVALGIGGGAMCYELPLFHILAGGALLGAIFMATDYSTSPMTHKGMLIYGVGIGLLTMIIRLWGAYPEGMSFAIFIMNAATPLINKYFRPKRFGVKK